MMGYNMMGSWNGGMMFFGWLFYILLFILMMLAIAALWKYVNKKK